MVSALIPDTQRSRIRATARPGSRSSLFLSSIPPSEPIFYPCELGGAVDPACWPLSRAAPDDAAPQSRGRWRWELRGASAPLRSAAAAGGRPAEGRGDFTGQRLQNRKKTLSFSVPRSGRRDLTAHTTLFKVWASLEGAVLQIEAFYLKMRFILSCFF